MCIRLRIIRTGNDTIRRIVGEKKIRHGILNELNFSLINFFFYKIFINFPFHFMNLRIQCGQGKNIETIERIYYLNTFEKHSLAKTFS